MRILTMGMDSEQAAFTYRTMPPQTRGKGGYGHSHKVQEAYCVIEGPEEVELVIYGAPKVPDPREDSVIHQDFWTE